MQSTDSEARPPERKRYRFWQLLSSHLNMLSVFNCSIEALHCQNSQWYMLPVRLFSIGGGSSPAMYSLSRSYAETLINIYASKSLYRSVGRVNILHDFSPLLLLLRVAMDMLWIDRMKVVWKFSLCVLKLCLHASRKALW